MQNSSGFLVWPWLSLGSTASFSLGLRASARRLRSFARDSAVPLAVRASPPPRRAMRYFGSNAPRACRWTGFRTTA